MKPIITILLAAFLAASARSQLLVSGDYGMGLKLAYDSTIQKLTGYFESYTSLDEQTKEPRFSCIFYIEGTASGKKFTIQTHYPVEKKEDLIQGVLEVLADNTVKIQLPEEHGGCWNVQHFSREPADFSLEKRYAWKQIRYVDVAKAYFYSDRSGSKRLNSFLIKGNFVCIEKNEGQWTYCTFFGKKITTGWIKVADLNKL